MSISLVSLNKKSASSPPVFEETIQIVESALLAIGIPCKRMLNELDLGGINLIFGVGTDFSFPIEDILKNCNPAHCIIFNLENLLVQHESIYVTPAYLNLLKQYVVLDYNQANVDFLNEGCVEANAFEFPLMPTENFVKQFSGLVRQASPGWDLAFFGGINERRGQILNSLASMGLKIKLINAYGMELAEQLLDCKAVLNIHFYQRGILEIPRCLIPLALGMPIISEASILPAAVNWRKSGIFFCSQEDLLRECHAVVSSAHDLSALSQAARSFRFGGPIASQLEATMNEVFKGLLRQNKT